MKKNTIIYILSAVIAVGAIGFGGAFAMHKAKTDKVRRKQSPVNTIRVLTMLSTPQQLIRVTKQTQRSFLKQKRRPQTARPA